MRIIISFLLVIISGLYFANAQSNKLLDNTNLNYIEFKGKVINSENNEPLIFANINLLESNISTISNGDGDFAIKIPKSHTSSKVQISFIGFKTRILNLKSLNKKNNTISLDVFITPLSETVLSIPKDVERLVRETLANVERNYIEDHTLMTAFYRETIKKKRRNVSLSEAVVNIYKAPYKTYQKRDGIKIL